MATPERALIETLCQGEERTPVEVGEKHLLSGVHLGEQRTPVLRRLPAAGEEGHLVATPSREARGCHSGWVDLEGKAQCQMLDVQREREALRALVRWGRNQPQE